MSTVSYRVLALVAVLQLSGINSRVTPPKYWKAWTWHVSQFSVFISSQASRKFFSIREVNEAIAEKPEELNNRPFQRMTGTRKSAYLEEEPVLRLHILAGFRAGIAAAWQYRHKQVCAALLTGYRIIHRWTASSTASVR